MTRVLRPETVYRRLFEGYPALFRTRADAIDHLWCVVGNGYAWRGGGLVAVAPHRPRPTLREALHACGPARLPFLRAALRREYRLRIGPVRDRGGPRDFYPFWSGAALVTVPRDVRPAWLRAAIEAADVVAARAIDPAQRAHAAQLAAALRRR